LIREVAGNPHGKAKLGLPSPRDAEKVPDPKAFLKEALVTAADLSGRRRKTFQTSFPQNRRLLLQRLNPLGPVQALPSWQRFVSDTRAAYELLQYS
jgi:hypothetical protein